MLSTVCSTNIHAQKRVTIYKLIDPETRSIKYVGQTSHPESRLREHIYEACRVQADHDRARWIRSVVARGLKPEMLIIEEVPAAKASEHEAFWIYTMRKRGEALTNKPLSFDDLLRVGAIKPLRPHCAVTNVRQQLSLLPEAA